MMSSLSPPSVVTKPIGIGAFLIGLLAGALTQATLQVLDAIGRGDPDAGFLLIAAVVSLPILWLFYGLIGCLPFLALRTMTPRGRLARLTFVLLVIAPVIFIVCLGAGLWLDGLSDYSPYFPSPKPPFASRLYMMATQHWRAMLFIGFWGGLTCWGVDQKSCLFSEDRSLRLKARFTLAAVIAVIIVPVALFSTCNQYVVMYRAQEVAGARPYCILVPTGDYRRYVTAAQRWQLSLVHMQASYQLTSGSRGGFYTTNHALLVPDDPREYRNWSYRSENFVTDPLINILHGFNKTGELLAVMELQPCVSEPDFVATLK